MKRILYTLAVAMLFATSALAQIIRVPADQPTIQAAINAAFPGDTVLVADGTHYENIDFRGKAIMVASFYLIDGDTTHVDSTIIDGSRPTDPNKGSVVTFISGEDTSSALYGFTITGGSGTWYPANSARAGGGIYCFNSGCMIVANKIINNSATGPRAVGGGLAAQPMGSNAWVVLKGNQITNNSIGASSLDGHGGGLLLNCNARLDSNTIAYNTCIGDPNCVYIEGGGIACQPGSIYNREIVMENNIISHNTLLSYCTNATSPAAYGGGVHITRCNGRLIGNEISHNETWDYSNSGAGAAGVAVGHTPDSFQIEGNIIRENAHKLGTRDYYGGGLHLYGTGSISVINNLITGNSATIGGGVVDAVNTTLSGRVVFVNNTIVNNIATYGGGIYFHNTTAQVMNTIIWGNQAPTNAAIHTLTSTIYVAYSDIQGGWSGTGNIKSDPRFVTGSAQLSDTSPCLGAGITSFNFGNLTLQAPNTDILGNSRPRPSNSPPDIGALEHDRGFAKRPSFVEVPGDYPTIQAGINAAFPGDTVLVADGTYYENIDFRGKAITVASFYLIDGDTTHVDSTIIDGSRPTDPNKGSVVSFVSGEDTTSVLYGFTITGGSGTYYAPYSTRAGGGIYCFNSGCQVLVNKIVNNSITGPGAWGGGLAGLPEGSNAYVVLRNNRIVQNSVTANSYLAIGGGVWLGCNATLGNNRITFNAVIQNATTGQAWSGGLECSSASSDRRKVVVESNKITHNSVKSFSALQTNPAALAGGISIFGSYGRLAKNEVSHNEIWVNSDRLASGAGIELLQVTDSLVVADNIIRENAITNGIGWGGGVNIHEGSSAILLNNIIEGNSATNGGAFIIGGNSTVKLMNNTVINNKATTGAGIYIGSSSTAYLLNTILWANQAPASPAIHIVSSTVRAAYCDIQGGWSGAGNLNADPMFVPGSAQLSDVSPCIGAGMDVHDFGGGVVLSCPPHDINGSSRPSPAGSRPDMGAWESPGPTAVESKPTAEIPQAYALHQNYPNPFNPSTTIAFALPKASFVSLKIYDLLGNEVATLVAEKLLAGKHQRVWEAKGLASGVYLYRLEAGAPSTGSGQGFVQTKKLILVR